MKDVCKPNNVTDHQQAMDDAMAAAVLQQTNRDLTEEPDSSTVSSDELLPTDDQMPSSEDADLPKEDL